VKPHRVVFVLFPGLQPLDVVGPHEVFAGANEWLDRARPDAPRYRCELVAAHDWPIEGESGLTLLPDRTLPPPRGIGTLLVPGGGGVEAACEDRALVSWVARAAAGAERLATVCSGTLLAAAAGVLDGRRVTTHWHRAEQLAHRHPELEVDPDPIYIQDGNVWTSAGVTAGIDLALALVEADHGSEAAQIIARFLVMFLRRPGGQSQFAAPVWSPSAQRAPIREAQDLIHERPGHDLRVPSLAQHVGMSPRNFSRVFTDQVGESPGHYVVKVRVEAARRLLEQEPTATVSAVARRCGFGTAETMRRAFLRRVGVPPEQYRRRFAVNR
jgi:transcriptional regulator GlxA family with amidase domain